MVMWPTSSDTQVSDLAPPVGSVSCSRCEDSPQSICISAECSTPKQLVRTCVCVTPGRDQVSPQAELKENSFPSLSQRVQVNRRILQQLLTDQTKHWDDSQSESREGNDTDFEEPNDSDSEIVRRDENNQSLFVSAWLPRQQQCEDGARMKRRCVPMRADHNLLTPDTHTLSGVRLHPVVQVRSECSRHLRDSCRDQSAVELRQRCPPAASPPRRLRFEDETETEAESRYLERQWQRRRVGQRGTGVLVSKPDVNLFLSCQAGAGPQGGGHGVNRQQRGRMPAGGAGQCDSCGTVLESGLNLNLRLHPPVPGNQGRSLYRTEPIKETYIGSVTPGGVSKGGGGAWHYTNEQDDEVMKKTFQMKFNPPATPTTDLPINPYASDQLTTPTQPSPVVPPPPSCPPRVTAVTTSQSTKMDQKQDRPAAAEPHRKLRPGASLKGRSHCVNDGGVDLWLKSSSSSSSLETTSESHNTSTAACSSDGQLREPMRGEPHSDVSLPEHFVNRNDSSRLSLRRLFSTVRLSRTRTGSLDRLSSQPRPPVSDPPTPPSLKKSPGLLRKTLSVQSLSVGSPFLQLRKSSSIHSFGSEQKKKDRSADYKPAADQVLQRCLSIEDVGHPCSVRSVGRVLQVCSDGTFLLELRRPKSEMFGFIVSRGRGRSDSGVYVEDMVDSSTEKLYAGLLGVGDEILEVNGEKVACLTLDEVTHLLTQNTSVTIRVLRHRRTPPR